MIRRRQQRLINVIGIVLCGLFILSACYGTDEKIKREALKYIPIQQEVQFDQDKDFYVEGVAFSNSNKVTILHTSSLFKKEGVGLSIQCIYPEISGGGGTTGQETCNFISKVDDKIVLHVYFIKTVGGNLDVYQLTIDLLESKVINNGLVQTPGALQ